MAKLLKLRRGSTTAHASFTGAEGEVTIDTTKDTAVVHDGAQAGGRPLAREDMNNVSSSTVVSRIGTSALAGVKVQPNFGTQLVETDGNLDVAGTAATGALTVTGNIGVSGTVDGRDVAADGTKLDGIESGATGDQTAAEIRTLVESASDSNVFTDADHSKLNGIEASATADQTAAEIRALVQSASDSQVFTDADHSKLDGIEAGATGDQTNAEIRALVNSAVDCNVFTNALKNKLDGIETSATADQTGSEIGTALNGYNVGTSGTGVANVYCQGWFRNEDNGDGLYNQSTNQHWYSDSSSYWNMGGGTTNGGIRFRDNHASTVRGYIYYNNSNDIGLLNSAGSWSLKIDNSGNGTFTGNVTAYSDARLKTNVNTINDALSIVGKLRGVSFDWIESGKRSIGVIAQEVEAVLPELVLTQQVSTEQNPEPKEVKSVDYGKIVGVLINAINELKAEVDELKGGK